MSENVFVAKADAMANSAAPKQLRLFPKDEWPVLAALALPCIVGLLMLHAMPGAQTIFTFPMLNVAVALNVIVFVVVFCLAFVAGSFAQAYVTLRPLREIKQWLAAGRASRFVSVPHSPEFEADAAGDLGREIAASVAVFSAMSVHNEELGKQKSELLIIAAHQLHTPMTEVRWGLEQLLDPSTESSTKEKLAENISSSLKRMSLIIDNIVASSDIDTDSAGYVFEAVDLVPILDKLTGEFRSAAQERKIELIFQHGAVSPVRADSYRLGNVFYNLLSNAIEYTPAGGKVTASLEQKPDGVECKVSDTGIGIPEKDMPMLFSKFHRGEHAKHMRPDGSGLGLYLVKNIITAHGSDLTVRSQDGAGTTISFVLPLS